jgi:tRNA (guanine26-N2/guanine27-N2)-dimethyltransferase
MDFPFPTTEVVEGAARLLVPDILRRKGPGAKGPWPFYNPTMVVNRDLSTVLLRKWPRPLGEILDGLAATGAWGIRVGLETARPRITFNDVDSRATDLIRANLARNRLEGEVRQEDLRSLFDERSYDFVDIDPFGPPTPFLGAAFRAARDGSGLGVTATDTAPLCGTYPKACLRRYVARPLRCDQGHEIGLRILLGYLERVAQAHGKVIRPILAFAAEHFLRANLLVFDGLRDPAGPMGYVARTAERSFESADPRDPEALGPLWTGPVCDDSIIRTLSPSEWTGVAAQRLLSLLQAEAGLPAFFVTTDELARISRGSPPKLETFLGALRAQGFRGVRTHFHPRGVKTDAPRDEILRIYRSVAPSGPTGGSGPAS